MSQKFVRKSPTPRLDEKEQAALKSFKSWAKKLDYGCCGFGYEGLVGLIPVLGDGAGVVFAILLINSTHGLHISKGTKFRMYRNVAIDFFFGLIPLLGDFIDVMYKCNTRNAKLLEEHLIERVRNNDLESGRKQSSKGANHSTKQLQNTISKHDSKNRTSPSHSRHEPPPRYDSKDRTSPSHSRPPRYDSKDRLNTARPPLSRTKSSDNVRNMEGRHSRPRSKSVDTRNTRTKPPPIELSNLTTRGLPAPKEALKVGYQLAREGALPLPRSSSRR